MLFLYFVSLQRVSTNCVAGKYLNTFGISDTTCQSSLEGHYEYKEEHDGKPAYHRSSSGTNFVYYYEALGKWYMSSILGSETKKAQVASTAVEAPTSGWQEYCPPAYLQIRFKTVSPRDCPKISSHVAMQEFRFFDSTGQIIPISATNPGGSNPGMQTVANLIDGIDDTNWLDANKGNVIFDFGVAVGATMEDCLDENGRSYGASQDDRRNAMIGLLSSQNLCTVQECQVMSNDEMIAICPHKGERFLSYEWVTTGDAAERDPISWDIEARPGKNDAWILLHSITSYATTTARNMVVGPFQIDPYIYYASGLAIQDVECVSCSAGKFQSTAGSSACSWCPANSNSPEMSDKQTACTCNAGSTGLNGGTCSKCAQGTYKGTSGSDECIDCTYGKYSQASGADTCEFCLAGKYVASEGSDAESDCVLCAEGKYSTDEGAVSVTICKDCSAGKFLGTTGNDEVCMIVCVCVAVCCGVLRCVALCCGVLRCVAACCSVLLCVAVCCSVSRALSEAVTAREKARCRKGTKEAETACC